MKLIDIEPIVETLKKEYEWLYAEIDKCRYSDIDVNGRMLLKNRVGAFHEVGAILAEIESMPKVDAIPVEWIENYQRASDGVMNIAIMLVDWREQNDKTD